jgi:hypothetical protein
VSLVELWGAGDRYGNVAAVIVECLTSALPIDVDASGSYDSEALLLGIVLDDCADAGRSFAIGTIVDHNFGDVRDLALKNASFMLQIRRDVAKSRAELVDPIFECDDNAKARRAGA